MLDPPPLVPLKYWPYLIQGVYADSWVVTEIVIAPLLISAPSYPKIQNTWKLKCSDTCKKQKILSKSLCSLCTVHKINCIVILVSVHVCIGVFKCTLLTQLNSCWLSRICAGRPQSRNGSWVKEHSRKRSGSVLWNVPSDPYLHVPIEQYCDIADKVNTPVQFVGREVALSGRVRECIM